MRPLHGGWHAFLDYSAFARIAGYVESLSERTVALTGPRTGAAKCAVPWL